jgi:hypothetical protein
MRGTITLCAPPVVTAEGSYSYAGLGYAKPHASTQIANGVSTTSTSKINLETDCAKCVVALMAHRHIGSTARCCDVSDDTLRNAVELVRGSQDDVRGTNCHQPRDSHVMLCGVAK